MTASIPRALPLDVALRRAVAHHKAGRLQEAEQLYRAILQAQPDQADANHNLGVLALQTGQPTAGLPYLKAASASDSAHGQYALSYAEALLAAGQPREALDVLHAATQRGLKNPGFQALRNEAEAALLNGTATGAVPTQVEMNEIVVLFDSGWHAEVERRARMLVEKYPNSGFAWKALGTSLQVQGKDALPALQKTTELSPDDAEAYSNLGGALRGRGQLDDALASFRRALEINPGFAEAHFNRAAALNDLGRFEGAAASCRRALEIKPDYTDACITLGIALLALGRPDEAAESYRRVLKVNPTMAELHINLGNVLKELGQLDDAAASYRRALEIRPDYAEGHSNLGVALHALGRFDEATASFRRSLAINPDSAEVHSNMGAAQLALGQIDFAVASYRQALKIRPDYAEAAFNLGVVLTSAGEFGDARACYRKAQDMGFDDAAVHDAFLLPAIMGTRREIMESRADFERNLDQLMAKRLPISDPIKSAVQTNFYLAFHGLNDRDLQMKVAKYYEHACPSLLHAAAHCAKPMAGSQDIRIGFLSKFFSNHSVSLCFSKIIETISSDRQFQVALISSRPIDEGIYSGVIGTRVQLPNHLVLARRAIAELELDILVYLDVGMEPLSYFLAFSRLARVQCVLGGHPVTTGIANMDYFLSADLMEPPDAADHYSEKLVRLPRPLFYFARPSVPAVLRTRAELGLPQGRHIYMCPMALQKIHPDFDDAISRILQLDGNGVIAFFEDIVLRFGRKALLARFERTVPADVRERILFLPWLTHRSDFISAIAAADVILDPFHFGIGSTAMTTFATSTPMVTKTGQFMRGRVGTAYCKMMNLPECIAEDSETYVQKAVQIAGDPSLRDSIRAKILNNSGVLYENLQPVNDLAEFFRSLS